MNPLVGAALASAAVPTVGNFLSSVWTNKKNQDAYNAAQDRANQFAREERIRAQQYNSLENQFAQMARVGMNPNLMQGSDFLSTQPMSNQSVSPPQMQPPQMPSETISSALQGVFNAKKTSAETVTIDAVRDGLVKQTNAQWEYTVAQTDVSKAELRNVQKQFEVLQATIDNINQSIIESDARTMNLRENTAQLRELRGTWRRKAEKEIDEIISRIATNAAQRDALMAQKEQFIETAENIRWNNKYLANTHDSRVSEQNYRKLTAQWQFKGQKVIVDNLGTQGKIAQWQLGQMQTYGELGSVLRLTNDGLQIVDQLIQLSPVNQSLNTAGKAMDVISPFTSGQGAPKGANPSVSPYNSGGFSSPSFSYGF